MKKIFILQEVEELTKYYHPEGGIVIIANNLESAKKLVEQDEYIKIQNDEWETAEVYNIEATEDKYWIMRNAGCC